jgi:hypothetical protein
MLLRLVYMPRILITVSYQAVASSVSLKNLSVRRV